MLDLRGGTPSHLPNLADPKAAAYRQGVRKIFLSQPNHRYGNNVFLPYSVGLLQAHAFADPQIAAAYSFEEMLFLREPVDTVATRWASADVVGLSIYVWNEQYQLALARAIKAVRPWCLIVAGGPQVPQKVPADYFKRHPYLDLLVHNEGEHAFADILREHLKDAPDYASVPGLTVNIDTLPQTTLPRARLLQPDEIPSPYLTGLFDAVFKAHSDLDFHGTQETHRGCLAAGVKVTTIAGEKSIEDVLPGERVLGWDENHHAPVWNTIEHSVCTGVQRTLRIHVGGEQIDATADHPFFTQRGWLRADAFRSGDLCLRRLRNIETKEAAHNMLLRLRPDVASTENENALHGQGRSTAPQYLQGLWRRLSLRCAYNVLSCVRFSRQKSMASGASQDDQAHLQELRHSSNNSTSIPRKPELPSNVLAGMRIKNNPAQQTWRRQPGQAAGGACQDKPDGQKTGPGVIRAFQGASRCRTRTLSSSARRWAQRLRTTCCNILGAPQAAVSVRRLRRLLDWAWTNWTATQSRLRALYGAEAISYLGPRNVLAYSVPGNAPSAVSGLPSIGMARVSIMGALSVERAHVNTPKGFYWAPIETVEEAGAQEVYDLVNAHPYPNFFANGVLVHNCPFSCTFCDWGSSVYTKVRRFSDERIKAEYDWMAAHEIELLYNADANFMLLPRDVALTDYLIGLKHHTGWPKQIRAAWTKNSGPKVFDTAKKLHEAGMDKGITLALQSMHEPTLEAIKRKNIPFDDFGTLVKQYQAAHMPVYSELILALPLETYDTFVDGCCRTLEAGLDDGLNIYLCMILPNSEMGDPTYQARYGMRTIRAPLLQQHCTPGADGPDEYAPIVIETNTMPEEDFKRAFEFGWAVQTFHGMGLLRGIALWWNKDGSAQGFRNFYEHLILAAQMKPNTVLGRTYATMRKHFERGLRGEGWGRVDPRYGDILWPLEEASFLDIITGYLDLFYSEIGAIFNVPIPVLLAEYDSMRTPEEFKHDLPEYAKQVVWYGRKGGKFKKSTEAVEEVA